MEIALAFLAGLLIGSFLNVCAYRLPRDLSVAKPARSFCPNCEKTIAWFDNVPVLSYLLLRGKCRLCGVHISIQYPLVELATAVAFAASVWAFGVTPQGFKYALFGAIMITLVASDSESRILPDEFTIGGSIAGLILAWFVPMEQGLSFLFVPFAWGRHAISLADSLLGGAVPSGAIWLCGWLYAKIRGREGLGFGDVKMIFLIGAFLGLPAALMTLVVASLAGAVGGLIFIKLKGEDASTYELPFGSFLGATALAVAAWSEYLLHTHPH